MNKLLSLTFESIICMALLYSIYWIFLRKETYFRFNRFYLLGIIVVALIIPLGNLRIVDFQSDITSLNIISELSEAVSIPEIVITSETANNHGISNYLPFVVLTIYLMGVLVLLTRLIAGVVRVMRLRKIGKRIQFDGYTLITIGEKIPPFSFMRDIYLNESSIKKSDWDHIINHEVVHIKQHHTLDNLLVEIFLAILWFNPIIWLIRGSLRSTHEYLADQGIINSNSNLGEYQTLLLRQINRTLPICLTNNFNSMIKKRLIMMCKRNSTLLAKLKPMLIVPVLGGLILAFACSDADDKIMKDNLSPEQAAILKSETTSDTVDSELFFIVEQMPNFQGAGMDGFRDWIADNLEYPSAAERDSIRGKVYVQFAVNSKGNVADVRLARGAHPLLDAEALRLIKSSPAWEPGVQRGKKVSVQFTFPINFVLE